MNDPETTTTSRIYRPKDACALLSISRPTLWRWQRAGIIPPARRLGPNTVGWTEQELLDFVASRPRA
jgi:predicted DNA-binding transcriptional regulator AlpA